MAFVHCHNCDWEQDDFWYKSKDTKFGYLSISIGGMKELVELLEAAIDDPSKHMIDNYDSNFFKERFGTNHEVDVREFVARMLENRANRIRGMHWMTEQDYRNDPNKRCPKCNSANLDID